jgi:PAS domain S-box-containing protein
MCHSACVGLMSNYDDLLRACSKDEESYLRLRSLVDTLIRQNEAAAEQHAKDVCERRQLEDLLLSQNGQAVQRVALDLLNHHELTELLQVIVDSAVAILDATYGEIMFKEGDELVVRAFTANQQMLKGDRTKREEDSISWQAVDTRQPTVLDDYQCWPKRREIYAPLKLRAVANFPIMVGEECVGVLAVARSQENYPFSQAQVQKGIWFAQLVALSLDITLLYDKAKREIREYQQTESSLRESTASAQQFQRDLKTLHEVNLELTTTETTDELCLRTVELAQARLGIDRIGVFLIDPERNELVGTFGIDAAGNLRDEHYYREVITPNQHWIEEVNNAPNRVAFWSQASQFDDRKVVGEGWKVAAGLWDGRAVIGYIFIDNLLTQRPPRPYEAELISLLAATVGHMVTIQRAHEALRQSEMRMRYLLQNGDVMFTHSKMNPDGSWRRVFVSDNSVRLSGYTLEQLSDWSFWSAQFHPDDFSAIQRGLEMKSGEPARTFEYRFRFADGRYHWVQSEMIRLPNPPDGLPELLTTGLDITERKEVQDALRQSEERLRFLLSHAPVMIFSYRVDADQQWEITFVSENASQLLGYPNEHYTQWQFWRDTIEPEHLAGLVQATMKNEARISGEYRIRRADGVYRWLYGEAQRTNPPGAPIEYVGYGIDITERKMLEEVLLEEERLRVALAKEHELSDLKTRIMSRISHEFRTPLSIIHTASDILERYYDRLSAEKRLDQTRKIRREVYQITHILDEINQIMRPDSQSDEVLYGLVDLEWLISSVIANLREHGEYTLSVVVGPEAHKIHTDTDILRSILSNLVSNAVKFSLPAEPIMITAVGDDEHVTIQVCDHGIGIPQHELGRVTEAFYRGTNIPEVDGIGLGLTVVEDAVKRLGGTLNIESVLHEGTTVTVTLPRVPPQSRPNA